MEGGDLVVVDIGGDERLRGELLLELAHMPRRQVELREARRVGSEIVAHGGHDARVLAEELQVVGDVAGGAAEFPPDAGHPERDGEDVYLLGEYVVLEG